MKEYTWCDGLVAAVIFICVLWATSSDAAEVLPNVTKEQVCVAGYSASVRPTIAQIAKWKRANIQKDQIWSDYVVDHIVPLSIGGAPLGHNLQLQTHAESKKKDILENKAHRQLCRGEITLSEAQARFHDDVER